MRYLILGINGMAGHVIGTYLIEKGHDIIGLAKQESKICDTIICDVRDREKFKKALESCSYDVIINCIGVLNKFVDMNLADGIYVNSYLPHYTAQLIANKNVKLIHISTDCVFEGTKGAYKESDIPDSTSYYGRSKALGEVIDDKNLTLRTSIIGPEIKRNGIGLYDWFMKQNGQVSGYTRAIWSGVTTIQLAHAIEQDILLNQKGLYHLSNNENISKYNLLKLMNEYCRNDKLLINKYDDFVNDKSIVNTNSVKYDVPSYEQMLKEMGEWIREHKELYPMYNV